ncbi:MAG: Asp23/Gls24 family envelope stress response protein [Peptococcaceae bacterium]|nr:Asp23/Gls24 family envelope stress response protein [Peptococcaceae bacterium]MBQ3509414.1 Asp23/Gls24 family envelope stress response protein [Peptococcaceae bacterium]MBR2626641.1 Asp23/Gls24 family envelope stress response protein [Peptococcaceae bacterium]
MPESKSQEHTAGETVNAYGSIKISEDAIAGIVSMVAAQIKGISAMSGSMTSGLTEMLGKKNLTKGVKVELDDQDVIIALYIFVEYGVKIPKLALEIQNHVRDAIQNMTGLRVKEVNIYVQGISFDHTEPVEEIEENQETEV